ncbi:hypothetical protein PRUPE_5G042400 [Prunus persica]|uniref:Uncharacterized protein n=1 Tax=Prunus persica TaxID=3760 RepID=A0A251P3C7_PRUPE|nr:hypothetical protein PRUPE_5G042400 [Prunus persica]
MDKQLEEEFFFFFFFFLGGGLGRYVICQIQVIISGRGKRQYKYMGEVTFGTENQTRCCRDFVCCMLVF